MIVNNILDIEETEWERKIGNFRWREFNYSYLKSLGEIGENLFKFIILDDTIIPYYYDDNNISNTSKEIMGSFLEIMCNELEVKGDNAALVFIPETLNIHNDGTIRDNIFKIINSIKLSSNGKDSPSLIFFYSEKDLNICNVLKSMSDITKTASYNSELNIKNMIIENYEQCLSGKRRYKLKKAYKSFIDNSLEFKKFKLEDHLEDTYSMYKLLSDKYNDPYESYDFWVKLADIDEEKLQWYGIFIDDKLIRFVGFWVDKQNVILSMTGRDEHAAKLFEKINIYFIFNYKLIETAINLKFNKLYYGYGLKEAKLKMHFDIVYQSISFIK